MLERYHRLWAACAAHPREAGGAACGLPGTDTASTGGKPDRRIRGNLAQFGGSSARPPVIGVAPLARDSIQGFFGCSQGSRSAWKGYLSRHGTTKCAVANVY